MSNIPAKMIELGPVSDGVNPVTLDKAIVSSELIPISVWGESTRVNIEKAINYLKSVGGGSVRVPANESYNLLIIKVILGKDKNPTVRYEYTDWRPPNNISDEDNNVIGEFRPYTESEPWQVGDIIHNSDLANSDDKAVQWYCVVSGSSESPSGTWKYIAAELEPGSEKTFFYNKDEEKLTLITT